MKTRMMMILPMKNRRVILYPHLKNTTVKSTPRTDELLFIICK